MGTMTGARTPGNNASTELTGRPIEDGNGNWYFVAGRDAWSASVAVWKSTDDGANWIEQDTSNRGTSAGAIDSIAFVQVGTTIHIVSTSMGTPSMNSATSYADYYTFHMSDASTGADTFQIDEQIDTFDTGPTGVLIGSCDVAVRSDGDVVAVYRGADRTNMGTDYTQVVYNVRTSGTWGGANSLLATNEHQDTPRCVLGASDDTHIIYAGGVITYGDTLSSADSLGTRVDTGLTATVNREVTTSPVVFTPSGGSATVAAITKVGTYGNIAESSWPGTMATEDFDDVQGSYSPTQDDVVWDGASGDDRIYTMWIDSTTQDLWYDWLDDGDSTTNSFTNTTEAEDAVTAEGVWADVFDDGAGTVDLVYIFNDNGTFTSGSISLATGTPKVTFTGSATATTTTGDATLAVDHNFSGDTTYTTTTGNATLTVTQNFSGSTSYTTTTGDATLTANSPPVTFTGSTSYSTSTGTGALVITQTFSGDTTYTTATGNATFARVANFSGDATATTTTGAATLKMTQNFSGSATVATTTGDATLTTAKSFTGSTSYATSTGTGALVITQNLTGSAAVATTTGNATLVVTQNLTGSTAVATSTGNATLTVTQNFSGSATVTTTTGDATLTIVDAVTFTGTATYATSTGNGTLKVTQTFTGSTSAATSTGNATLTMTRNLDGTTTYTTVTGDATFTVTANTRTGLVTWAELELPDAGRSALVTWAELELGDAARVGRVTWSELELPDAGRTAQITWAELETGDAGRSALITWSEMEFPPVDFSAVVTWAEVEFPNVGGALDYSDVQGLDELGILRKMSNRRFAVTNGDRLTLYRRVGGGNGDLISALNTNSKELIGAINERSGDPSATELLEALRNWAVSDLY